MKYFPRALRYLRPYWKLAVVSIALLLLSALISVISPWPFKYIVDHILTQKEPLPHALERIIGPLAHSRLGQISILVLIGFALALAHNVLQVIASYVNTKIEQSMTLDFRSELFQHAQSLSLAAHEQRRSGMLIYTINNLADGVPRLVMALPPLTESGLTLVGMFCVSFYIDRVLAVVSMAIVPVLYASVWYYVNYIQPRLLNVKQLEGESLSIIHEAISMMRVIVAFGREPHEYQRFRTQGQQAIDARIWLTVRQTFFSLVVNTTTAAGAALVLGIGAVHVLQGRLELGGLLVVMYYIAQVYKPLEAISTTVGSLQDVVVSLKMAFDLLDKDPDIKDRPDAVAMKRAKGRIVYKDVGFSYTGRCDTLKGIDFAADPGQVIAVVGPTGAGKTTLVSLLPRLYDAREGRILLDGVDIRKLTLKSLREQISIVLQEPLLFSGTIADNIRYGRLNACADEIVEAARAANAHDFIMGLPQTYETELGERGVKLSGGERQRIAVARAFIKDAPILILDEPTSSIDSKTEAVILDALDRLMVGRTTFMIAHRLSTVRRADVILVMEGGQIVEQGSHADLMRRHGLYRQLHDIQTSQARARKRV